MAAIRNTNYYEMGLVHPKVSNPVPLYRDGYQDGLEAIDDRGHVPIPQGPGLGVEINWDWVDKRRTGLVEYP
jgi:L-alanine-DL-glutamate epimerase-like enolase superfamily enzyme